jgi:hypothetical protein
MAVTAHPYVDRVVERSSAYGPEMKVNTGVIPRLHVGRGETVGAMTLFPLWADGPSGGDECLTGVLLDQAEVLSIGEVAAGPTVPELTVENLSASPVLLVEGETIAGGSQSRMLNVDVLVPANSRITVPVSCVEVGRWSAPLPSSRSRVRGSMGLRKVAATSVHASRAHGSRQSDQGAVWSAVAGYEDSFDSSSPTGSYLDAVESARERLDELASRFAEPRAGQCGVVVGIGGHVRGLELFGSERLLRAHWEDLVRGAAADSLGAAGSRLVPAGLVGS